MALHVFLLEDNPTIRDNLVSTLDEEVGAEVVMVASGEAEARRWLAGNSQWGLAIVDLFVKDGSGLGVLRAQKGRRPEQRVVVLSNYATTDMRTQCLLLGADRIFDKSTELEAFLDYVGALDSRDSIPGGGS